MRTETGAHSALALPLADENLFARICAALSDVGCKRVTVVPAFEPDARYEDRLRAMAPVDDLSIVTPDQRSEQFLDGEPSDSILLVDSRYYPVDGHDFSPLMDVHREHRGAVFLSGVSREVDEKIERVVVDSAGNVRKVQRIFDQLVWGQNEATVVPACVIPYMLALHGPQFPLSAMRRRLADRGVPLHDLPTPSTAVHLNRREDLLRVCWDSIGSTRCEAREQRRSDRERIFVGQGAVVAESARVVGHVVLHEGARIDHDATVIGPALLGRGSVVGCGATVAQSVLLDHVTVPPRAVVHQQVVAGGSAARPAEPGMTVRRPTPVATDERFRAVLDGRVHDPFGSRERKLMLAVKRTVDIAVSLLGLMVLSPLMIVTIVLAKLTSPGPAFFVHPREGKDGRVFGCIKFRTMRADAHGLQRVIAEQNEADGPQFTIKNDPRTTTLGRFLRKRNIDELPQLVNVLLGHMSLVGPRPSPFRENQVCAPWRSARLSVRPGITGLWQLCRHARDEGDFHQWIYYDTAYVRNLSPWLDCKILFYTLWTLGGMRSMPVEKFLSGSTTVGHGVPAKEPCPVHS